MKSMKRYTLFALTCLFASIYSMNSSTEKHALVSVLSKTQHLLSLSIIEIKDLLKKPENAYLIKTFSLECPKKLFLDVIENESLLLQNEHIRERFLALPTEDRIQFSKRPKNHNLIALLRKNFPTDQLTQFLVNASNGSKDQSSQKTYPATTQSHTYAKNLPSSSNANFPAVKQAHRRIKSSIASPQFPIASSSNAKTPITLPNLMPNPFDIYKQIKDRMTPQELVAISKLDEQRKLRDLDSNADFAAKLEQLEGKSAAYKTKLIYEELVPMVRKATAACGDKISQDLKWMQAGKDEAERDAQATALFGMFMKDVAVGTTKGFAQKMRDFMQNSRMRKEILYDLTLGSLAGLNQLLVYGGSEVLDLLPENAIDQLYQGIPRITHNPFDDRVPDSPHEIVQLRKAEGRLQLELLRYTLVKNPSKSHEIVSAFVVESLVRKCAYGAASGLFKTAPAQIRGAASWLQNTKDGNDFNSFLMRQNGDALKLLPKAFTAVQADSSIFKIDYFLSQIPKNAIPGFNPAYFSLGTTIGTTIFPLELDHATAEEQRRTISLGTASLLASLDNLSIEGTHALPLQLDQLIAQPVIDASAIHWLSQHPIAMPTIQATLDTSEPRTIGDFVVSGSVTPQAAIMILYNGIQSLKAASKSVHQNFEALKAEDEIIALHPSLFAIQKQLIRQTTALFVQVLGAETYSERNAALMELNSLSSTRIPGKSGLYAQEAIDALSKLCYDSATGELTKTKLNSSEKSKALAIFTNYLKAISSSKEEYIQALSKAAQSDISGIEMVLIEAQNSSFTKVADKTWARAFQQLWNKGQNSRNLHNLIVNNPNNKLLYSVVAAMQNGCILEANKNTAATWQAITKNVLAINSNENIPKIYRSTIKHLYQKYYRQFFGDGVKLGTLSIPLTLTEVPAWSALTSQDRSSILADATKTSETIERLKETYLKSQKISKFLGIAHNSSIYPITYDLVESVTHNRIDTAILLDRIAQLSRAVPLVERSKFLGLFRRNVSPSINGAKTELQVSQDNFQLALSYLQCSEECSNTTLSELYREMAYLQAFAHDMHELRLLKKYNFLGLFQNAEQEQSQISILNLVKQSGNVLRTRNIDAHYATALSHYLIRLAGTAKRAHDMGLYADAQALAQMPITLLGSSNIIELEKIVHELGPKVAIQKIINDNSEQFLTTLKKYSDWLANIQEQADSPILTGPNTITVPEPNLVQLNNTDLRNLYIELQNEISTGSLLLSTDAQKKMHKAIVLAYARVTQLIMQGYQISILQDKQMITDHVKELIQQLKNVAALNQSNQLDTAQDLLKDMHNRAKRAEFIANQLLRLNKINPATYGTYKPNTNALLGVNFLNDSLEQAKAISTKQPIKFVVIPDIDLDEGRWEIVDLEGNSFDDNDNPIAFFAKRLPITTAELKALQDQLCNAQPPFNNNDDEDQMRLKEELDNLLRTAEFDWEKFSELAKQEGYDISAEELKALFKPESGRYDHFMRLDIDSKYNPKTGLHEITISGHHLDKLNKLEKAGLIKYNNITRLDNGFWQADTHLMGLLKMQNCYFPSHWDEVQVMKAVIESMKNPFRVTLSKNLAGKITRIKIDGLANNTQISVILNTYGEIHTAFPIKRI